MNGFSIGCMYVRPWRLMTAMSVPSMRLVRAPAAARDLVRAVVERPQDAVVRLEERVDLALVPDVVAGRDDVDAVREEGLGGGRRQAHAAGDVLAVGGDEVDAALLAQAGQRAPRRRLGRACR